MKAVEYFVKYDLAVYAEAHDPEIKPNGAMWKLIVEFSQELKEMAEKRHIQYDRAVLSLIREQNDKWNALVRLFEKKYGVSPIKRDGFKAVIKQQMNLPDEIL